LSASGKGAITSTSLGRPTASMDPFGPGGDLLSLGGIGTFGPEFMSLSWDYSPYVFLTHDPTVGPSPSGQPYTFAVVGSPGTTDIAAAFTVTYILDAAGLPSFTVAPIMYPVLVIGGKNTFDATISYADNGGPLGTLTLHFAPPTGFSPPSIIPVVGDPGFVMPALPGGDTLTLSGSFALTSSTLGIYPSTEIKVFGADVPEPGTWALLSAAVLVLIGELLPRRRLISRR